MSNLSNQLPTQYQQFIHLSRYSRWLPDEGRREFWNETIERYFNFFKDHLKDMKKNYKTSFFKFFDQKNIGSLPRIFLSCIFLISFFILKIKDICFKYP